MAPRKSNIELKAEETRNKLRNAEEEYEAHLALLESFVQDGSQWSNLRIPAVGVTEYEKLDHGMQAELEGGTVLGSGGGGQVYAVRCRKVNIARKAILLGNIYDEQTRMTATEEGIIHDRVGPHRHIIRLVGTYWKNFPGEGFDAKDLLNTELHILTFPVALFDLDRLLIDCEEVSAPHRLSPLEGIPEALERLVTMGFHVSRSGAALREEIRIYLQPMMGCLAEAVHWMHSKDVQHRDIKPGNILVRPAQVLLTDFGISRDRLKSAKTTTDRHVGSSIGYTAPEIVAGGYYNPRETDVYSLGCVFLHILTVIHGPNVRLNFSDKGPKRDYLENEQDRSAQRVRHFREYLKNDTYGRRHPFIPDLLVEQVLAPMFIDVDRSNPAGVYRPSGASISRALRLADGEHQEFHGECCRRPLSPGDHGHRDLRSTALLAPNRTNANGPSSTVAPSRDDTVASWTMIDERTPTARRTKPFEFPEEKKWYCIINQVGGKKRLLQADDRSTITVDEFPVHSPHRVTENQIWQFRVADTKKIIGKPLDIGPTNGLLYFIYNITDPGCPLSIQSTPTQLYLTWDTSYEQDRDPNAVWYFRGGWGIGGDSAYLLTNERLDFQYGLGYTVDKKTVMKKDEGVDTFWFLEEAGLPYQDWGRHAVSRDGLKKRKDLGSGEK